MRSAHTVQDAEARAARPPDRSALPRPLSARGCACRRRRLVLLVVLLVVISSSSCFSSSSSSPDASSSATAYDRLGPTNNTAPAGPVSASLSTRRTWTVIQRDGPNHHGLWLIRQQGVSTAENALGRKTTEAEASKGDSHTETVTLRQSH